MTTPQMYRQRIANGLCGHCGKMPLSLRSRSACSGCLSRAAMRRQQSLRKKTKE